MIDPGDTLIFYTDGVTEQFSPDGEMFGEERLLSMLATQTGQSTFALFWIICTSNLGRISGSDPPSDDVTLLRHSPPAAMNKSQKTKLISMRKIDA
jgi:phosphoserine phosphatase RsbU/P